MTHLTHHSCKHHPVAFSTASSQTIQSTVENRRLITKYKGQFLRGAYCWQYLLRLKCGSDDTLLVYLLWWCAVSTLSTVSANLFSLFTLLTSARKQHPAPAPASCVQSRRHGELRIQHSSPPTGVLQCCSAAGCTTLQCYYCMLAWPGYPSIGTIGRY